MKKRISILLAAVLLLSVLAGCNSQKTTAEGAVLSGADVTAAPGERVAVPITLSGMDSLKEFCNERLAGFQFDVTAEGLSIIGATTELADPEGNANWTVDDSAQSDGSYMIMVVDMNLVGIETTGEAEIAQLYLDIPADASGEYTVTYSLTDVCDTDAASQVTEKIAVQPSTVTVK